MPIDYKEFASTIKTKYPQYKDVDDLELSQKMVEKYPEYKDKVTFEPLKKKTLRDSYQNTQRHFLHWIQKFKRSKSLRYLLV